MKEKKDLIKLGFCSKPHGIKGAFSFHLDAGNDSVLDKGSTVTLFPLKESSLNKNGETFRIKDISYGNKIIVYLENVNDRNLVETMLPFEIFYPRNLFPELGEGEFYLVDLIGLKVIDHDSGEEVGKVSKFFENGVQVVLEIRGERNFDLPMVDHFVPVIDIEAGLIEVIIPTFV